MDALAKYENEHTGMLEWMDAVSDMEDTPIPADISRAGMEEAYVESIDDIGMQYARIDEARELMDAERLMPKII